MAQRLSPGSSSLLVTAYTANTTLHLIALALEWPVVAVATKALITILLAGHLVTRRTSVHVGLFVGLGFALAGDLTFEVSGTIAFMAGMALFAGTQLSYVTAFMAASGGHRPAAVVASALVWAGMSGWLASSAASPLREIAIGYGALLATMAACAWRVGWVAGLGGALFLLSDALLGAKALIGQPIGPSWLIILTYAVAQLLIVLGLARRSG